MRPGCNRPEIDLPELRPEFLFEQHLGLADALARRFGTGRDKSEDLRQVARTGLLLAARRFDPDRGGFSGYAAVTIIGELKKHLRSNGWAVHVPRGLQEDSITVGTAAENLTARLARSPSIDEIADHTGFTTDRVLDALRARDARFGEGDGAIDGVRIQGNDPADTAIVAEAVDSLDTQDRELIGLRFSEDLSQSEIARRIGISQPQVHRRLTDVIDRLRIRLTTYPERSHQSLN